MAEERIILHGRAVYGGKAEGEALVSKLPLMGWGNIDEKTGIYKERNHPLKGMSVQGKILVFPEPRGSGGFIRFGRTVQYGTNPLGFVFRTGNCLTIMASLNAKVPSVTDFDKDPMEFIETGDYVIIDGDAGTVEIIKKAK
jgi:predicted aconitase with swiveling domain